MSDTARNAVRNTGLLVLFYLANPLLSLALVGTISRKLGAEGLGAYNLLLSYYFVTHAFTSLGLNPLITREVSRDRSAASRFLVTSGALGLSVTLMVAIALGCVMSLTENSVDLTRGGWIVALALFPAILALYGESIFIAYEKVQWIVYLAVVENVAKVAAGLWLVHSGYGVTALIGSFAVFRFMNLALNLVVFHRTICPLRLQFDRGILRLLLANMLTFGGILVATTLYWRLDVFLLSRMKGLAVLGYYAAAYRVFTITQVIPQSFDKSIYPVFAKMFVHSQDAYRAARRISIRYALIILLPIAAGIHGLADPIVRLLFGKDFSATVPVLKVVIWTLVPYGVVRLLASGLYAANRQSIDLKVNLIGLSVNIGLNLVLIPRYEALGSAWATLISIVCFLGAQCFFLREDLPHFLNGLEMMKPVVASGFMLVVLHFTGGAALGWRVLLGALAYAAGLIALQGIKWQELKMVLPQRVLDFLPADRET